MASSVSRGSVFKRQVQRLCRFGDVLGAWTGLAKLSSFDAIAHRTCARTGQWEELLPLCTFQGDFSGLRDFVGTALVGNEAKMVEDLHWVLESRFARASAVGAITTPADWHVTMGGLQGVKVLQSRCMINTDGRAEGRARVYVTQTGEQGQAVRLAAPGSAVGMETSLVGPAGSAATAADGSGPINKLDAKSLEVSH